MIKFFNNLMEAVSNNYAVYYSGIGVGILCGIMFTTGILVYWDDICGLFLKLKKKFKK